MATGEVSIDRAQLEKAVQLARDICGYEFAIFVGELADGRNSAIAQHAGLRDPDAAILIAVDPVNRTMDIVTGSRARLTLDDQACEFAILALRSSAQVGDLTGGLRSAVSLLAEHARAPRTLHLDEPA
jgi:ABC-type uncharacterized transport system ATPase component